MSTTSIPVGEAAKDFLRLVETVERTREPAVLVREGKPVATLNPMPSAALTCAELADRWPRMEKLSAEEGNELADDVERGRASLPPLRGAWD